MMIYLRKWVQFYCSSLSNPSILITSYVPFPAVEYFGRWKNGDEFFTFLTRGGAEKFSWFPLTYKKKPASLMSVVEVDDRLFTICSKVWWVTLVVRWPEHCSRCSGGEVAMMCQELWEMSTTQYCRHNHSCLTIFNCRYNQISVDSHLTVTQCIGENTLKSNYVNTTFHCCRYHRWTQSTLTERMNQ